MLVQTTGFVKILTKFYSVAFALFWIYRTITTNMRIQVIQVLQDTSEGLEHFDINTFGFENWVGV